MPLLLLIVLSLAAAAATAVAARRLQRSPAVHPVAPAASAEGGRLAERHPRLRRALRSRMDPAAATGLALTAALIVLVAGGLLAGLLAVALRSNPQRFGLDARIGEWAHRHATTFSTHGLDLVTQLGATATVILLAAALAVAETLRRPDRWIVPFLVLVLGGEQVLSSTIKELVDRARPTLNPIAETLGPSFPSGHTTAAAAFYAAAALLLGRGRSARMRTVLAGAAVGVAVGVACSRVLLDVHWVSDVIGGLALGWAWFAVCAIAFGGRLLRFGVTAEAVGGRVAEPRTARPAGERPGRG
jgi:membrane-associated phospholipid phosphatase